MDERIVLVGLFRWLFGARSSQLAALTQERVRLQQFEQPLATDDRRRLTDVPYVLPKDLEEGERLNLQHYLLRYALKGNFSAPLDVPVSRVLDVGSGTGIWGQEMAQQFPLTQVFSVDLEPPAVVSLSTQAKESLANYHFIQGNILQGLPFPDQSFDFTHQRLLVLALPAATWSPVIRELIRVTRKGGWIELMEIDVIKQGGPLTEKVIGLILEFVRRRGIEVKLVENLGSLLQQEGLKQVTQRFVDIPIGSWGARLGNLMEKDALAGYAALKHTLCRTLAFDPDEYDALLQALPEEWSRYHSSYRFVLVYGQV
jgi:SAM-dependent methyltransferase